MYYLFIYLYTHYLTLRWYSSLQIAKAQIWDILKNQCTSTFIIPSQCIEDFSEFVHLADRESPNLE